MIGVVELTLIVGGLLGCGLLIVALVAVAWAVSSNRRTGSS